jgi:hypothetical protein
MTKVMRSRLLIMAGAVAISPIALVGSSALAAGVFASPASAAPAPSAVPVLSRAHHAPSSGHHDASLTAAGSGEAMIFQRPSGAMGLGHVGWAFYDPSSETWSYGAVEGGTSSGGSAGAVYIPAGQPNGAWNATGSWSDMISAMNSLGYTTGVELNTGSANLSAADTDVAAQAGQGYSLIGNNCATTTYNILSAYGATGLPNPSSLSDLAPNDWVSDVQSSLPNTTYSVPVTAEDPDLYDPNGGLADDPGATDPGTTDPGSTDPGATDPSSGDDGAGDDGGGGGGGDFGGGGGGGGCDDAYVVHLPAAHVDGSGIELTDEMIAPELDMDGC